MVEARSEEWAAIPAPAGGREAYDAVTIRAVGSLATDAELASPLLREGGVLVIWKGEPDQAEQDELARALPLAAMTLAEVLEVEPYKGSRNRRLYVLRSRARRPRRSRAAPAARRSARSGPDRWPRARRDVS